MVEVILKELLLGAKMKQISRIFTFAMLLLVSICIAEDANDTFVVGPFQYQILEDGTAEIVKYTEGINAPAQVEGETVLEIPDSIEGHRVTSIGRFAFIGAKEFNRVNIPEGITRIGFWAFADCSFLETVILPESIRTIDDGAFTSCKSLRYLNIPDGVTYVGENPFKFGTDVSNLIISEEHPYLDIINGVLFSKPDKRLICDLKSDRCEHYSIPYGVRIIGSFAFYNSPNIKSFEIPGSVETIGDYAFCKNTEIQKIAIPEGVRAIGESAFDGCSELRSIIIPGSVKSIGKDAFKSCMVLKEVQLKEGVTTIGECAFAKCYNLELVVIPASVTSIGENAFDLERYASYTVNEKLTMIVTKGSYAEQYCIENEIAFVHRIFRITKG
ncbi:MAG: leucine-rich repeat domain-containing protein [Clostridia bacterium]|nr:leucine-rich repeat domain-containing protein [Clostridia bacterium]